MASWFLTTISLALVHERLPERSTYPPLPDVFLDNVPASDWGLDVSEILIIMSTTCILVLVFFHRYRYVVYNVRVVVTRAFFFFFFFFSYF